MNKKMCLFIGDVLDLVGVLLSVLVGLARLPRCLWDEHDDVIKWKLFLRYWPFVRGIRRSPVNSPHKGQWRRALMFSLIYTRINGWVNNREAGDLRRHRAHYDVIVMDYMIRVKTDRYLNATKFNKLRTLCIILICAMDCFLRTLFSSLLNDRDNIVW